MRGRNGLAVQGTPGLNLRSDSSKLRLVEGLQTCFSLCLAESQGKGSCLPHSVFISHLRRHLQSARTPKPARTPRYRFQGAHCKGTHTWDGSVTRHSQPLLGAYPQESHRVQSGRRSGDWWHREESTSGDLWAPSGGLHWWPLEDLGAGATAGGPVVRVDAEPGLHHQGALRRVVLALVIGTLAAGVEVALSLLGGTQVRRTAATEGLVGHHQALHLPRLGASLAGSRTRTPGGDEPTILAVLALARPHGRGLGQVGAAAGGRDVELGSPFGHTDKISALCAGATI